MALTDDERDEARDSSPPVPEAKAKAESQPPPPAPPVAPGARLALLWVVPTRAAVLLVVYLGERVLEPMPTAHVVVTALGLGAVSGATLVRFLPKFRVGGERSDIEKLLGALSVLGVAALAIYFVTSDFGWDKTGLGWRPTPPSGSAGALDRLGGAGAARHVAHAVRRGGPLAHAPRRAPRGTSGARGGGQRAHPGDRRHLRGAVRLFRRQGQLAPTTATSRGRGADSTRKIAESLNEPLEVVAFFPQVSEVKSEVLKAYLDELGRGTPNLKIEIEDRLLVPKRAKELKATQDGVIVLAKGKCDREPDHRRGREERPAQAQDPGLGLSGEAAEDGARPPCWPTSRWATAS